MTNLVKRLREKAFRTETYELVNAAADRIETLEAELVRTFNNMMRDADRIEKLEAALAHIYAWYPVSVSDPTQTIKDIREFARKALEGKDE